MEKATRARMFAATTQPYARNNPPAEAGGPRWDALDRPARFSGRVTALILTCALLFLAAPLTRAADAEGAIRALLRNADLGPTKVSVTVVDADTGSTLVELDADEPMIPASNMKLITTAAALDLLGSDFVFQTELGLVAAKDYHGEAYKPDKGHGPALLIRGSGDPALGDPELLKKHLNIQADTLLEKWVSSVVETGVKKFDALVVDDRIFDRQFVHHTWPEEQLNRWYCAEVAGLNFYDNCIDVIPDPTQPGLSPAIAIFPYAPFIQTTNRAKTGKENTFWISRRRDTNEITFRGVVAQKRSKPYDVTVHDPPIFFGRLLAYELSKKGIEVGEVKRPGDTDAPMPTRALHITRTTLPLVLQRTNQDSQNLFAECLLKRLGHQVTGTPGSFENGGAAIRIYLNEALGPRSSIVAVADGSGMSRDNQVTTHVLANLLRHMHRSKNAGVYRQSLSYCGKDPAGKQIGNGTLAGRFDKLEPGTWVFGKSGYINSVSSLSGYLVVPRRADFSRHDSETQSEQPQYRVVCFSIICNGFKPPLSNRTMKDLQDAIVDRIETAILPAQTASN